MDGNMVIVRQIMEKHLGKKKLQLAFIELEKAFHMVPSKKMMRYGPWGIQIL